MIPAATYVFKHALVRDAAYESLLKRRRQELHARIADLRAHRLNLDTGACFGGELTAAAFTDQKAPPMFFVNSLGAVWQP